MTQVLMDREGCAKSETILVLLLHLPFACLDKNETIHCMSIAFATADGMME